MAPLKKRWATLFLPRSIKDLKVDYLHLSKTLKQSLCLSTNKNLSILNTSKSF